ncbi:cytochrome c/c1 heme-lyase [Suillus subalutaceus]|uniref:cytochrome c/c1 heme-lyase n=1 Tax=Suillus subalutaceus TaxID=48586 RepID=UPI001B865F16|nr:cytochrome c/c1 heme-lyase [Suillus subalutaceus]KAG1876456.1 cytochrome c/c1 heme-lyase [Suillus subalutaceus]
MGQSISSPPPATVMRSSPPSSCPMHDMPSTGCPIQHNNPPVAKSSGGCPIDHSSLNTLNPTNQMPNLPQTPIYPQSVALPTERTMSSIPRVVDAETRTDTRQTWEYPSPQQFYNALVRKGLDTPAEHVETVVEIHNFLNERAWGEVLKWERKVAQEGDEEPHLARFKGRPGEMSPKARFWMLAGWLLPSRFNTEPPFDRHDWIVRRPRDGTEVRYVIDYYSAPSTLNGDPGFALDVRPALDSFESIQQRVAVGMDSVWEELREKGWGKSERGGTQQAS